MGAITSKPSESHSKKETMVPNTATPKHSKVLPFDPRSPSEQINRTPITVNKTPDCDRALNQDATLRAVTSQILFDPRSPSSEVTRTPIVVEEKDNANQRTVPLRPSRLAELQSASINYMSKTDPRSPTDKVPRTPIEEKTKDENLAIKKELMDASNTENTPVDKSNADSKFPYERDRHPLTVIGNENLPQNSSDCAPIQSHTLEEEFSKNENVILKKLGTENHIKSDTAFVETI